MDIENLNKANQLKKEIDLYNRYISEIEAIDDKCSCFYFAWTDDKDSTADPCIPLYGKIKDDIIISIKEDLNKKIETLKKEFLAL